MSLTLISTLVLPVQQGILPGVVIRIFLYIFQAAKRMTIMELVPTEENDSLVQDAPK